jgi:hypothetical protein
MMLPQNCRLRVIQTEENLPRGQSLPSFGTIP